jgi:damage-control phosphatase, subfamily III
VVQSLTHVPNHSGLPKGLGEKLDEEEPGWRISGKYVSVARGVGPMGGG